MSIISDIYDAMLAACETALPNYDVLANPYIPEENANNLFDKAFGIAFGPGLNENRIACPKISINRSIDLVLINKVTSSESNTNFLGQQQKDIFEDLFAIIKTVYADNTLNEICSKFDYSSDAGLEFIDAAQGKYYLLSATFPILYFDNI